MSLSTDPAPVGVVADGAQGPIHVSRIFASARDETRVRRPVDIALAALMVLATALAGWASRDNSDLERWVADIVDDAPQWLHALSLTVFSFSGIVIAGIVVLVALRSRWALIRDVVTAIVITLLVSMMLGRLVTSEWPDLVPELTSRDVSPEYPIVRVALIVAVLVTVRSSLTAPVRRFDRWLVVTTVIASLILGYATLWTVIGGLTVGAGAGAVVRVLFGSSDGIPTLDRIAAALVDLRVDVVGLAYDAEQPHGWLQAHARDAHGSVAIRVYGRDAADSAVASRVWRAMWYRDSQWSLGVSRQQLAEHEALLLLLAERADLRVPEVVAVGATSTGDVVLVTRDDGRTPLSELSPDDIDDDLLDQIWVELGRLHAAELSHGRIDPSRVTVAADDRPGFRDLALGTMSPSRLQRRIDVVELVVTTALLVGQDRAIAAATRPGPRPSVIDALATVQPAALSSDLSDAVRGSDIDVDKLRSGIAAALDIEAAEPVKLRRVRWRDVAMIALALVVANSIISWVVSIDLDTFADELAAASVGWLIVAFVISQCPNIAETVSMKGVVTHPLPFGPTMQFQYATSYIGLAVPSDAGRIAMTIRYLQKLGVPTRIAVGQGPFTTVFGYLIDVLLLVVTAQVVGTELELPDDADFSGFITILIILVVAVVIGLIVVLAVPKLRRRIVPAVAETIHELKGSLTDPSRAAKLLGGLLAKKLLFALTMATILTAYDEPLSFATVVFVNTAVSWFAGIMPVPGGIGVAEAGFVVGLSAFGVPESTALAVALTHRLFTSYLPPVAGFFAMKRLERQGYL